MIFEISFYIINDTIEGFYHNKRPPDIGVVKGVRGQLYKAGS